MRSIIIVFRKELTDTLRDKRTLMSMLLAPLILYPLLMYVFAEVSSSQQEESMSKVLKVAVYDRGMVPELVRDLEADDKVTLTPLPAEIEAAIAADDKAMTDSLVGQAIRGETLDIVLVVAADFSEALKNNRPGGIDFYFNAKSQDIIKERIAQKLKMYESLILDKRYRAAGLERSFSDGLAINEENVATRKEILGTLIGGFLPYIFIILCFTGSMYPAIDLAAGEKERGTIETILTAPVTRLSLVLGKIGVIMLTGLTSAVLALLSIVLSLQLVDSIPVSISEVIGSIISPTSILLLILMLIPLALLFASLLLSLSIYAKSYKEAQSIITPLLFVIIFPAFIGLMPGTELTATTAMVPILNVSLVSKALFSGTLSMPLFGLVILSQVLLAGVATWFSIQWFGKERVLLR